MFRHVRVFRYAAYLDVTFIDCFGVISPNSRRFSNFSSFHLFRDYMLHTLRLSAGVVVAVSFKKVDDAPTAKARADGDHNDFERVDCGCEKCHNMLCRQNRGSVLHSPPLGA